MATKSNLTHSIISTLKRSRAGSYSTRYHRKKRLILVANELIQRGYKIKNIQDLQLKHVQYLVGGWLERQLDAGTIKNRMTDLGAIMELVGKGTIIPQSNDYFNIPHRQYVTNEDKSRDISDGDLSKIADENTKMSLLLQKVFGLRRRESIKLRINQAIFGDELRLRGSWSKNGRPRTIKIQYLEQWEAIDKVQIFVGENQNTLIPTDKSYKEQLKIYENQVSGVGLSKMHGLRHAYAQRRYLDLIGWECPAKGGPSKNQLSKEQKILDKFARQEISIELGHERMSITAQYIGN